MKGEKYIMEIKGIIPALITPFDKNQKVDYGALTALVDKLIDEGVGGFYACGSTSECFLLDDEERLKVAETVIRTANGRVPVIVHVGHISAAKAAQYARHAESVGADKVSAVPPFYYKFTIEELGRYYHTISEATKLPVVVYSIPCFSGVAIDTTNLPFIMDNCNVGGLKYTDYNLFTLDQISRKYPDLPLYCGHDEIFLNALPIGLTGAIGSTFNVFAPFFNRLQKLYEAGNMPEAAKVQKELNEKIDVIIQCGVNPSIKYLLGRKGIPCGDSRDPFAPLTAEQKLLLDKMYDSTEW